MTDTKEDFIHKAWDYGQRLRASHTWSGLMYWLTISSMISSVYSWNVDSRLRKGKASFYFTVIIVSHSISRGLGNIEQTPLRKSATFSGYKEKKLQNLLFLHVLSHPDLLFRDLVRDKGVQELHHHLAQVAAQVVWILHRLHVFDSYARHL